MQGHGRLRTRHWLNGVINEGLQSDEVRANLDAIGVEARIGA
jgi:hypothetical protein